MKPIRSLLKFLTPDICVGCSREGRSICSDCSQLLAHLDQCIRCKKPSLGGMTCDKCIGHTAISAFIAVSNYSGVAKDLVAHMKYHPSSESACQMGELMAMKLPYLEPDQTIITHTPTTTSRIRERGFDQANVIAKSISRASGMRQAPLLRRLTKSHQVGYGKKARQDHMIAGFAVKNNHLFVGKTVVLVDDVLTTGATLESASKVLRKAGAKRVIGVVFARAE